MFPKRNLDLSEYTRTDVDYNTAVRYGWCPFCEHTVGREGFIVWRQHWGWRMYCHRCHTSKRVFKRGVAAPSALINAVNGLRINPNKKDRVVYLPDDFEQYTPNSAKRWLRKYGVTDEEISKYRFGYSANMNRLIMPVFNSTDGLVFWQGRKLNTQDPGPKYISMKATRDNIWFDCVNPKDTSVVLVEDILSALAVKRAGFSSIALLGSHIGTKIAKLLQDKNIKTVCVWLDPDKRTESIKFSKRLASLGFTATSCVLPDKDPKEYNPTQVKQLLLQGGFKYEDKNAIQEHQQSVHHIQ